jgi:hypothetical protein
MTPLVRLVGIVALIGVLLAGAVMVLKWETAPTEKLAAAEKAVNEARAASAPALMPDDFARLEDLLAQAKKEIADQDAKLGFLRNYEKADQLLTAVQVEAARLIREAGKRQEEMKSAAVEAQHAAQEAVMTAQDLLEKAPAGKDRAALALIKADVQKLVSALRDIQAAVDARDYQAAQAKANYIQAQAKAVAAEIERALAKVRKARGK